MILSRRDSSSSVRCSSSRSPRSPTASSRSAASRARADTARRSRSSRTCRSRPGRRLCRPPRLARALVVGAPRGEDRHHPVEHGARFVAKALSPAGARGLHRRRDARGDRRRPRRPARARDRQRGPERPPRDPPDGLEDRHRVRDRVRAGRGASGLRRERGRGLLRPLCRDPLERQALPERDTPGSRYCGVPAHQALVGTEPERSPGEEAADLRRPPRRSPRSRPRPPARAPTWPRTTPPAPAETAS